MWMLDVLIMSGIALLMVAHRRSDEKVVFFPFVIEGLLQTYWSLERMSFD